MDRPCPGPPRERPIRIDVTVVVPRKLLWLLAVIAFGSARLSERFLEIATIVLRALLSG